jgi:D-serine deaminase-like pyridoxal phosphate-dependent protein
MNLFDLDTPALVLDLDKVEANINEMADATREAGVRLRPHTKTHKIPELARMQLAAWSRRGSTMCSSRTRSTDR